jgi:hypothetical protein
MRNRVWIFIICFHCLGILGSAQVPLQRQVVLSVANGGFVSFRSETSTASTDKPVGTESLAALIRSQALPDQNLIIHRVLSDGERRVIFGYDLWVNSDPISRKFSLAVLPAADDFRRTFLKEPARSSSDLFATFPKSTKPQTLDDGDAVSLDLLVNPDTGLKIVDVVRVTFDRTRLLDILPGSVPKDFTLDAVSMSVRNYDLFIDGQVVGKGKSTFACTGSLLWIYIPGRGRFIFSLVPREGYDFRKLGVLQENRIEFLVNNELYEWASSSAILPNGGSWNLWVLHDPNYTPLFRSENTIAKNKSPGVLQKLKDAVVTNSSTPGLNVRIPNPPTDSPGSSKSKPAVPQRVMVGGADSMDHLLPKSP